MKTKSLNFIQKNSIFWAYNLLILLSTLYLWSCAQKISSVSQKSGNKKISYIQYLLNQETVVTTDSIFFNFTIGLKQRGASNKNNRDGNVSITPPINRFIKVQNKKMLKKELSICLDKDLIKHDSIVIPSNIVKILINNKNVTDKLIGAYNLSHSYIKFKSINANTKEVEIFIIEDKQVHLSTVLKHEFNRP